MLNQNTNMNTNTPVSNKRTTQQLHDDLVKEMLAFAYAGESSRSIAKTLGVSKSSVNNYVNRSKLLNKYNTKSNEGPRILFYDLEVAGDIGLFFGRHKINISQEAIVRKGGFILCASWKKLNDKDVQSIYLTQGEVEAGNDSRIVEKMQELYAEHDAVICHNSKGYDHKVLQARSAYWDMHALPSVKVLDTLELARRNLRLPSNKLGIIAAYFNLPLKMDHSGISLWVNVQSGDRAAMNTMVEYCKQDVVVLEEVYHKLRHTGKAGSDFNAAMYFNDDKQRCRTCGSEHVEPTGRLVTTASSAYEEYTCIECGSNHRVKVTATTKEKRKNLLV